MKLFRFFSIAIMAIVLCAGFTACSNENDSPVVQEEKKMCTVNINVENIVKVEEQPMGRAEENTDLYLISFTKGSSYSNNYAYGLFDNLSNISINLVEGDTYTIQASAVKDAKNQIASTNEGFYANPFMVKLTNSFIYENDNDFVKEWGFNPTLYRLKSNDSGYTPIVPNLEVFLGYAGSSVYEAKENGDPITISFSRFAACSAEFKVVDMPTGYLKISISNKETNNSTEVYTTSDIIVNSEAQSTFQYITFGSSLWSSISNDGVPCILNLTWVKDNNTEIPLIPAEIKFKRDTKYIITIKVDNSTTSTINVNPIPNYGFTATEEIGIYGQPIPNN